MTNGTDSITHPIVVDKRQHLDPVAKETHPTTDSQQPRPKYTASGLPVNILWVPYLSLSLLLVGLILFSFVRYHRDHGHKYRRRRAQLQEHSASTQLGIAQMLNPHTNPMMGSQDPPGSPQPSEARADGATEAVAIPSYAQTKAEVATEPPPKYATVVTATVKNETNKSLERKTTRSDTKSKGKGSNSKQTTPVSDGGIRTGLKAGEVYGVNPLVRESRRTSLQPCSSEVTTSADERRAARRAALQQSRHNNSTPPVTSFTSQGHDRRGNRRQGRRISFTSNANGSMVDLRCGEHNSVRIYRDGRSFSTQTTSFSVEDSMDEEYPAVSPVSPSSSSAMSPTGLLSSDYDDDSFLLRHVQKPKFTKAPT